MGIANYRARRRISGETTAARPKANVGRRPFFAGARYTAATIAVRSYASICAVEAPLKTFVRARKRLSMDLLSADFSIADTRFNEETIQAIVAERILTRASAQEVGESLTFEGRFRSEYNLAVDFQRLSGIQRSKIFLGRFALDNLNGPQDLGDIEVPLMGNLRVQFAFGPEPAEDPYSFFLSLAPSGDEDSAVLMAVETKERSQVLDAIAIGSYEASIQAEFYKAEPESQIIEITPGDEASISFLLHPEGIFKGYVLPEDFDSSNGDRTLFKPRSNTMRSENHLRTLEPLAYNREAFNNLAESSDEYAMGPWFAFRNLESGVYTLEIQADGYQPHTQQVSVTPGVRQSSAERIRLKPLP